MARLRCARVGRLRRRVAETIDNCAARPLARENRPRLVEGELVGAEPNAAGNATRRLNDGFHALLPDKSSLQPLKQATCRAESAILAEALTDWLQAVRAAQNLRSAGLVTHQGQNDLQGDERDHRYLQQHRAPMLRKLH